MLEGKKRSKKCVCNKSNRKGTPSQTSYTCERRETSRMKAKRKGSRKDSLRQHAFQNQLCDLQCAAYILIVSVKENYRYFFCIYKNHHTVRLLIFECICPSVNLPPSPTPCNHSHHVLIILVVVERRGAVFTVTVNNHLLCITHFLIL